MNAVMPAKAGIHDLTISQHFVEEKSWIPAGAGMTVELPRYQKTCAMSHRPSLLVLLEWTINRSRIFAA